jgi:hypothetical protein
MSATEARSRNLAFLGLALCGLVFLSGAALITAALLKGRREGALRFDPAPAEKARFTREEIKKRYTGATREKVRRELGRPDAAGEQDGLQMWHYNGLVPDTDGRPTVTVIWMRWDVVDGGLVVTDVHFHGAVTEEDREKASRLREKER